MKQKLIENQGIPGYLLLILAIISGLAVANLYYNQPLLNDICRDLKVSEFTANLIPMVTQIGYALGLLFIIPLGDLYSKRRIIVINFSLLSISMLSIALSESIWFVLASSLVTGICSVMPQIFIPIASQFSRPEDKSKNVGILVSGLLTGILGSRVISGMVGEYWGWRTMYYLAAVIMFVCIFIVLKVIPDMSVNYKGTYKDLMHSLLTIFRQRPDIRLSSLRAGLCFGSFLALWACLAFKLSGAPLYAGNNVIGLLGLCGVAGALTASIVGRYVRILGVKRLNYIGCMIIMFSWAIMYIFQDTYLGFIIGIMLIDIGMQCIQLSNQTYVLTSVPNAANRVNTIFMTTYFVGGALGTFLAGLFWQEMQWEGVVTVGVSLTLLSLLITRFSKVLQ
ncbi:MFS transporter [Bacteroides caecigallinarum]|uniref:MFS transporter n=1 Tax=Bacteroides caecigallinarum TaxID=1411144 RepID=UPI00195DB302|nr:MFS transporter [Bacteroides caecigallinarum]MBM6865261.1 MFS transporter [Bacteroides caecigallinarum]